MILCENCGKKISKKTKDEIITENDKKKCANARKKLFIHADGTPWTKEEKSEHFKKINRYYKV